MWSTTIYEYVRCLGKFRLSSDIPTPDSSPIFIKFSTIIIFCFNPQEPFAMLKSIINVYALSLC